MSQNKNNKILNGGEDIKSMVQEYTGKSINRYGVSSDNVFEDLRDIISNEFEYMEERFKNSILTEQNKLQEFLKGLKEGTITVFESKRIQDASLPLFIERWESKPDYYLTKHMPFYPESIVMTSCINNSIVYNKFIPVSKLQDRKFVESEPYGDGPKLEIMQIKDYKPVPMGNEDYVYVENGSDHLGPSDTIKHLSIDFQDLCHMEDCESLILNNFTKARLNTNYIEDSIESKHEFTKFLLGLFSMFTDREIPNFVDDNGFYDFDQIQFDEHEFMVVNKENVDELLTYVNVLGESGFSILESEQVVLELIF